MSPQQKKELKAKAHKLKPVVMIGQHGLSDNVIAAVEEGLTAHELIKIKVAADRETHQEIMNAICEKTKATYIQTVGRVSTIYRRNPDE